MTGDQLKGVRSSFRLTGSSSRLSGTSLTSRWMGFKPRASPAYEDNDWRPPEAKKNWWHAIFVFSGISLLVCLLQMFLPPPFGFRMMSSKIAAIGIAPNGCDDGLEWCICPRETVCATDVLSMALLVLARSSAFFDYPLYMMMFLSKAHNINNVLRRTVLREWIGFADMHHVHSVFGLVIGVEAMSHSFFHIVRWAINGDIRLLWQTNTGVSGFIAMTCTPLIVLPMLVPRLKVHLRFEVRKGLHYLFYFWALSLMWHAPSRIYYIIGVPFSIYVLDYLVGLFLRNHLIENVHFERYGEGGVALHFENPKGFDSMKTSYVYIMCPWISKWQWHAFTAFPDPTKENHTMLCIGASGDWTKKLHDMIKSPCLHCVYVSGPYASEFSDLAVDTTNAIAIASGIGITPTLSLMLSYTGKKRVNVLWMCRDPGLIEYFLHKVDIYAVTKNSFVLIFYTGKRELVIPKHLPANFFIFRSRPNLEKTISWIITAIQSGDELPEEMYEHQKALASIPFHKRIKIALSRITSVYSKEEMFEYSVKATATAESNPKDTPKRIAPQRNITRERGSRNLNTSRLSRERGSSNLTESRSLFTDTEDETTSSSHTNGPQLGESFSVFMNYLNEGSETSETTQGYPADVPDNSTTTRMPFASNEDDPTKFDGIYSAFMNNLNEVSRTDDEYPAGDPEMAALTGAMDNVVSVNGLEAMIYRFLSGIGEYARSDIENLFQMVDIDGSGYIDKEEFDTFLDLAIGEEICEDKSARVSCGLNMSLIMKQPAMELESSCNAQKQKTDLIIGDASTIQYLEQMARETENPLEDWSMFYCGASTPIEKALKGISKKYSIDLGVEKFNW